MIEKERLENELPEGELGRGCTDLNNEMHNAISHYMRSEK